MPPQLELENRTRLAALLLASLPSTHIILTTSVSSPPPPPTDCDSTIPATTMARTRSKRGTGSADRRKRSSRRKQKHTVTGASDAAQNGALEGFATLPFELKAYVIQLACSAPCPDAASTSLSHQSSATSSRPRPRLDVTTTLSLMRVSQSYYSLIAPILYSHVWISRPSALASFHLALSCHPHLGLLVKSLHIGPDDELPGSYDPLVLADDCTCEDCGPVLLHLMDSLRSEDEVKLLPRWCSPSTAWPLANRGRDAAFQAVCNAILTAQRVIDIDLARYNRSVAGDPITTTERTIRLWEVQACLDCYLMALRRWEDEPGVTGRNAGKEDLPVLMVTGYARSPSVDGAEVCSVSRSDILRHLARPHSITD